MPIIPQPGPKSLRMANTGSACYPLGKVRSQPSKFLDLRQCWLQKVEACGCCHHRRIDTATNALWWPTLSTGKTNTHIKCLLGMFIEQHSGELDSKESGKPNWYKHHRSAERWFFFQERTALINEKCLPGKETQIGWEGEPSLGLG